MDPRAPVDDFQPLWPGFAGFLRYRTGLDAPYLTELHHSRGSRRDWTAGQWRARVEATAQWLRNSGAGEGDAVASLAGNTADALAVAYACWLIGACCVPLNAQESLARQEFVVNDAKPVMLIYAPEFVDRATDLGDATGVPLRPTDSLPAGDDKCQVSAVDGLGRAALRLYTSGTTGEPKGIVTTVGNLLTDLDALATAFGWDATTRVYTVLPP